MIEHAAGLMKGGRVMLGKFGKAGPNFREAAGTCAKLEEPEIIGVLENPCNFNGAK
jgi:hypothetical protein